MATGSGRSGDKKAAREARERARLYQARQDFQVGIRSRRRRDDLIAGVGGGLLILAVIGGQIAYYTAGPGTPAPAPSPAATTPIATPTPTPTPTSSPLP